MNPEDLLYTKSHEWVRVKTDDSGAKTVEIGLTAHALELLNDVTFIELAEPGTTITAGDSLGEVESAKAVSDYYAPVDGEVIAVNDALADNPGAMGDDPYTTGWIARIRISDESGLGSLMDAAAYQKLCDEEA